MCQVSECDLFLVFSEGSFHFLALLCNALQLKLHNRLEYIMAEEAFHQVSQ